MTLDIHAGALSATSGSTSSTQIPNNTPHHIRIRINRIGLKDTSVFIEPHLVVSVKNRAGRDLCAPMRSNTAADRTENHISCEFDVIVPLSLESISREDGRRWALTLLYRFDIDSSLCYVDLPVSRYFYRVCPLQTCQEEE